MQELELHQLTLTYRELRIARPAADSRLMADLAQHGQRSPVLVVAGAEPPRYVLIDGYRRVAALGRLGQNTVRALVAPLSETEALLWRATR